MATSTKIEKAIHSHQHPLPEGVRNTLGEFASLGILRWNDNRVQQVSVPIDYNRDDVARICSCLKNVMTKVCDLYDFTRGFGLAAPQLGILKRAFVFGFTNGEIHFAANPRIVESSLEAEPAFEGCLSLWEWRGMISRPKRIIIEFSDEDGVLNVREELGGRARLLLHEIDHLDGVLYPSRMGEDEELISLSDYALKNRLK